MKIAFPSVNENEIAIYTVTYNEGPEQNPKGNISMGDKKIHVQDKMIFNCTPTSQS